MKKILALIALSMTVSLCAHANNAQQLIASCSTNGWGGSGPYLFIGGQMKDSSRKWTANVVEAASENICLRYSNRLTSIFRNLSADALKKGTTDCRAEQDGTYRLYLVTTSSIPLLTFLGDTDNSRSDQCLKAAANFNAIIRYNLHKYTE